ncbi:unnamed protein product [Callosobruchus maculatus]|nr:unnamed protein product [Callosobruchus maculatus]
MLPILVLQIACGTFSQPVATSEAVPDAVPSSTTPEVANMLISIPRKVTRQRRECCYIHTCEEVYLGIDNHSTFKCYEKYVCGGECYRDQAGRRRNSLEQYYVPQFSRRSFVDRYICRHGQCVSYKFDCGVCPDPARKRVNIAELTQDCVNCYY